MDNLHYTSTDMVNDTFMLRFDGKEEDSANPDDVLARRIKNRERQRRYRAHKREQANTRKALTAATQSDDDTLRHYHHQHTADAFASVPLQIDDSVNIPSSDCSISVHSMRNWKRDARKANIERKPECNDGNGETSLDEGFVEADDNPTKRIQLSRRQWKSDARNKKSLE